MSWSYDRARTRIGGFARTAPQVVVERFDEGLELRLETMERMKGGGRKSTRPLYDLPPEVAVIADTVHVYVNLVNYDEMRLEEGRETESSHARAMAFLHLHYAAMDRVVEETGAQRVDFHGARLHAVIAEPPGPAGAQERVARGLRLALETTALADAANRTIFGDDNVAEFRIGIDSGVCVAIDSGREDEREPLFIGPAANYAAKLAVGDEPGVFLSPTVRRLFDLSGAEELQRKSTLDELDLVLRSDRRATRIFEDLQTNAATRAERWAGDIREHRANTASARDFVFHSHRLPLRTINYSALMPSNSIRMPMVSVFADIDGYTRYIDQAISRSDVAAAVRNLHVIRSELNAVVQDDFAGRKVRFIGDCIHGLIADGEGNVVDDKASVDLGAQCVGALRSSFNLCQGMLAGIDQLGLAIGFEFGPTPVSRIGIRGDRAVRVASSKATINSEACQGTCNGIETMIGEEAYRTATAAVRALFPGQIAADLTYDDVAFQPPGSSAAASAVEPVGDERSHGC